MIVLAIDPGPLQSAFVMFNGARVLRRGILENNELRELISERFVEPTALVIERIASYGMAVGAEVFETVFWEGRFYEAARAARWVRVYRVPRVEVKVHLCHSARAKDVNVRLALLDRFGGLDAAKGTKRDPGPLYGVRADEWAALALAVTWYDRNQPQLQIAAPAAETVSV